MLRFIFRAIIRRSRRPRPSNKWTVPTEIRDSASPAPVAGIISGKCHVIDGDTIVIRRTKIRIAGINAPELHEPWGQKSKWAMVEICRGQIITAELSGEQSYDRLVATCYLPDGCDIGAELVKQGLALDGGHFSQGKYRHLEPTGARRKLTRIVWDKRRG